MHTGIRIFRDIYIYIYPVWDLTRRTFLESMLSSSTPYALALVGGDGML